MANRRETGKAPGTPGRETEILKGLQPGNPSSTGEPETKSEGPGTQHRHAGDVRLRQQAGARVRTAPKALSSHLDFILQGLVGRFWKAVTHNTKNCLLKAEGASRNVF